MKMASLLRFATNRDYSLVGPEAAKAIEAGLANGEWYKSPVPRKRLKELMQRSDGPAIRDTILWLGLILVLGALGVWLWGSWWAVPVFAAYGVLYASAADSRWHECGHRTAFRTVWMNDAVYALASFFLLRSPTAWRWSHTRHHTDTIIVGRDPEIAGMRPPQLIIMVLNIFGIVNVPQSLATLARYAVGRLNDEEKSYIPEMERGRVRFEAWIILAIHAAAVVAAVWTWSLLPVLLIGGPNIYGIWLLNLLGNTQHLGLAEDVLDHRLDARTVYMNPVFRFLYWNMNYHVEHHMYPMVPYHALLALHEEVKADCPPPSPNVWAAWAEIIPTIARQLGDPSHFIKKQLPPGAGRLPERAEARHHG
jgi:fatty acid desaturase